jgi:tagatose-1,6-bisphosphate aldolase
MTSLPTAPTTTPVASLVISLGKLRRLQRISDADGFIRVAAIDHPENYLALFDPDVSTVGTAEVVESKLELIAAMAPESTAVLVDPVWSFGQSVLSATVPPYVGMISGLELLAYSPSGFGTETVLRDGWSVETLARLGADAAKLVVFYRSERADVTTSQHEVVRALATDCARHQVPLVVEPLWYPLEGETLEDPATREARVQSILRSATDFAALDDSLEVPWVLLSSSATYDQFREQLQIAASAGACGFMAGRAIWGDAVGRFDADRRKEGARTAAARLRELHDVLREHGHGWQHPIPVADTVEAITPGWYDPA